MLPLTAGFSLRSQFTRRIQWIGATKIYSRANLRPRCANDAHFRFNGGSHLHERRAGMYHFSSACRLPRARVDGLGYGRGKSDTPVHT
jgi:hypothetical protein